MKKIAKSRVTSFVLMCAMVLTMFMGVCLIPAYAAEPEPLELIPVEDMDAIEITAVGNGELILEDNVTKETGNAIGEVAEPYATTIRNTVSTVRVSVYPIVYCLDDGSAYIINNIYRSKTWANGTSSESLRLSSDETTTFIQQVFAALANDAEMSQYEWGLIGWSATFVHLVTAEKPLRVEFTPSSLCNSGTDTRTMDISDTETTVTIKLNYNFPENPNNYYNIGFSGAFYFRYTSGDYQGKEGGLMMGGGVGFNSSLAS